jgi:phosphinothricin acetyltransferase
VIRDIEERDFDTIVDIYNHYIRDTNISFEEIEIDTKEISTRIDRVRSAGLWWLVFVECDRVLGYAYATPWNDRSAYRYSVEVSVYLDHQATGQGIGNKLYGELFHRLRGKSIHAVIGGIALPNPGSIKLHEKFGMQQVAHYKQVGYKFGQWVDVGYWQVLLNE